MAEGRDDSCLLAVGTYSQNLPHVKEGFGKGIHLLETRVSEGKLDFQEVQVIGVDQVGQNPTYLAKGPKNQVIFLSETPEGGVGSFHFERDTSSNLSSVPAGVYPCHVSTDSQNRLVFVANYGSDVRGSVTVYKWDKEAGKIVSQTDKFTVEEGGSTNPNRQTCGHAHQVYLSPCDKYLFVTDLGKDKVYQFVVDYENSTISPNPKSPSFSVAPGSGPRHVLLHPNNRFIYVLNELVSAISVCGFDSVNGVITDQKCVISLLGDGTSQEGDTGATLRVNREGTNLYVSHRDSETDNNFIAVFSISQEGGSLSLIQTHPTSGRCPRDFILDPSEKFLIVANQDSHSIFAFPVDQKTGTLSAAIGQCKVGAPVSVLFV